MESSSADRCYLIVGVPGLIGANLRQIIEHAVPGAHVGEAADLTDAANLLESGLNPAFAFVRADPDEFLGSMVRDHFSGPDRGCMLMGLEAEERAADLPVPVLEWPFSTDDIVVHLQPARRESAA